MTFTAKAITTLPKREPPKAKEVDLEAANALLGILASNGKPAMMADPSNAKKQVTVTAEDGVVYASTKDARNAANKAKRLLAHVLPDGLVVKTRVYPTSDDGSQIAFAIWLAAEEAPAK